MTGVGLLAAEKFWILDPLYGALGTLLAWFYGLVPSYGVAIILLTLAVRIITLPLTAKQARSQQAMQRVAPELKRLQAKYKHDKQKLNEEMMKFYKEHHVNPFGGCLPVLIQAPVLIVLYRLILDLTAKPDPKHIPRASALFEALKESSGTMISWGIDLAQAPTAVSGADKLPYLLLVAAVVATGYLQQKQLTARVSKENINPQMAMMTKIFPVMFGFFSFITPAGVVVYFLVSNIWQIGQQAFLFRNQPAPETAGKDEAAKDETKGTKGAKPVAGPKGKLAAGSPPAKTKGTGPKGAKGPAGSRPKTAKGSTKPGAARGGAARSPAKGRPPARSGSAKGSGKGSPGNRPSGRVTPPKRSSPPSKGKPATKGPTAGPSRPGARSGDASGDAQKQRWWQKLRPAPPPAPVPAKSGGKAAAGGKGAKGAKGSGNGAPRPRPKAGTGKATSPRTSSGPTRADHRTAGSRQAAPADPDPDPSIAEAAPSGASSDAEPLAADVTAVGSGNGQATGPSNEGNASSPLAAPLPPASNGRGDGPVTSDSPDAGIAESAPEGAAGGAVGDGEPGTRSPGDAQKGED